MFEIEQRFEEPERIVEGSQIACRAGTFVMIRKCYMHREGFKRSGAGRSQRRATGRRDRTRARPHAHARMRRVYGDFLCVMCVCACVGER